MRVLDEKIENEIKEAIHSSELEYGEISEEEIELLRKEAYGEITEEEYIKIVLGGR